MRFHPDGPDIPQELLRAQTNGATLFLCGAGVSRTAGLPGFRDLVMRVYQAMHEDWVGHTVEAKGMSEQSPAFDRVLFALQSRLSGIGTTRARQTDLAMMNAVHAGLVTPAGALPAHANILRLSRGADTRPRVVTTNFDTLFEASWMRVGGHALSSHAGQAMPLPGSGDFEGVLHLHGRIEDADLNLVRSEVVLTSAQFGEAYLRSGWASRYVYDLARAYTLVIVGYGADDPPVRYLLEVLTADRNRFTDLKPIFAFVGAASDAERQELTDEWAARGTVPVVYDVRAHDHSALYGTLSAWADHAEDPARWRSERSSTLLGRSHDDLADHEWAQLEWSLAERDSQRLIESANPSPEWLEPLVSRVMPDRASALGPWIARRIAEPTMLDKVIRHLQVDHQMAWHIDRALTDGTVSEAMTKVWRLVARVRPPHLLHEGWFSQLKRVRRGEAGYDVQGAFAGLLRPMPRLNSAMRFPDRDEPTWTRISDYAWIEMKTRDHVDPAALLKAWPRELDDQLLCRLLAALVDALEEAKHLELATDDFDRTNHDVRSIARHPQDSLRDHGFYPLVRVIADLAERLANSAPDRVREIFDPLATSPYALARRLHLHAVTFPSVYAGNDVAAVLGSLDDTSFWSEELRREVMRLMVERWADLPSGARDIIEARLTARIPTTMLYTDGESEERIEAIRDRATFLRFSRLEGTATGLGAAGRTALANIRAQHPGWDAGAGDRADFGFWSDSRMGDQGDPSLLKDTAVERLVIEAQRIAEEDPLDQGEIWRKYVRADPHRAFEGLVADGGSGSWAHWQQFIWALAEVTDDSLARQTVAFLITASPNLIANVLPSASSWLDRSFDQLLTAHDGDAAPLMQFWDRLADHLPEEMADEAVPLDDPMMAVLNRPPGHLAGALLTELHRRKIAKGAGLPTDLGPRFERLLVVPGPSGFTMLAGLMQGLPWLHAIDPAWAEAKLLPRLDWADPWAKGLWLAYTANQWLGTDSLFRLTKPTILAAFARPELKVDLIDRLLDLLLVVIFGEPAHPDSQPLVSHLDVKRAIALSPPSARTHAAYHFFDRMRHAEDPAREWREVVGPVFTAVWPMQADLRSEGSTLYLTWMASAAAEAFPEAAVAVGPAILPTARTNRSMFDSLDEDRMDLYRRHPAAALALMDGLTDHTHPANDLAERLEELAAADPSLRRDPRFEKLWAVASRSR